MTEIISNKQLGCAPSTEDQPLKYERANTSGCGGLKAACFIIGMELCERLAYYAIQSNLLHYLTKVLHQSSPEAFSNVLTWTGVTLVVPILAGFLADAYWGRYQTIAILAIVYLLGLVLLTLSVWLPPLDQDMCRGNCGRLFFFALYLISLGAGGMKPCLEALGADQFDDVDEMERRNKTSFFNWWFFALCSGALLAITVVVYVENNLSWALGFGIPTLVMAAGCGLFFAGAYTYRCNPPSGYSPLLRIAQVLMAAARNANAELPDDDPPVSLHEVSYLSAALPGSRRQLEHTPDLRFLNKAALVPPPPTAATKLEASSPPRSPTHPHPRRLCTVTQVEEVKLVARVLPIWLTTFMYGVVYAQASTVYVSQVSTMETAVFAFRIPPASFQAFMTLIVLVWVPIYERAARSHKVGSRITTLRRIGVGLGLSILSIVAAALVDRHRLRVVASHGLMNRPKATLPMSAFWTLPQFMLLGFADVFTLVGEQEFFYDQVPDNMRSLGMALYLSGNGLGYFMSTLIQMVVNWASTQHGGQPWIQAYNVNRSRYDYYFWVLALLSFLNFLAFVLLANAYRYKRVKSTCPMSPPPDDLSTIT